MMQPQGDMTRLPSSCAFPSHSVCQRIEYTQCMLRMDQHLLALWNISHMAMQEHSLHLNQISQLEPGLLCSARMNQHHLAGAGQTSVKGAANVATPNSSSSVLFFLPN